MPRQVFGNTGSLQSFTVPAQCTTVFIEATGGGTASATGTEGQPGGSATGHLAVTPGDRLYIMVGGRGTIPTPTGPLPAAPFNGGGLGGRGSTKNGGNGAGASDVRLNFSDVGHRVIVAAGAGGYCAAASDARGGRGGDTTGEDGNGSAAQGSGSGGSQVAGGASGTGGTAGHTGGNGGDVTQAPNSVVNGFGGGGAGYFGGGSGFNTGAKHAGGGGSNYVGGVTGATSIRNPGPITGAAGSVLPSAGGVALTYNLAPSKPTMFPLTPYYRVDTSLSIGFLFNDTPDDSTSRVDVRWRPSSTVTWTELDNVAYTGPFTNGDFDYAFASNFASAYAGVQIEIQVRTYDSFSAVSPWSDSIFTTPMVALTDPVITVPATINTQTPLFMVHRTGGGQFVTANVQCWSDSGGSPGALLCEIQFFFDPQTSINLTWDTSSGIVTVPGFQFVSGTDYHFLLALALPANVYSDYVDSGVVEVVIDTPEPAMVTLTPLPSNAPPAIRIDIANPTSGDPFPATYNDIYRTDLSTGERLRIATNIAVNGFYTDFLPGFSTEYQYDVEPVYVP